MKVKDICVIKNKDYSVPRTYECALCDCFSVSERGALVKAGSSSEQHLKQALRVDEENMTILVVRGPCRWQQCAGLATWVRKWIFCKIIIVYTFYMCCIKT